uniref:Homeobox domain-containing protein n=1 Tax=Acanthochromis polyacanthus TaxID=80966 RepID=A0A3Q1EBI3_9TELE
MGTPTSILYNYNPPYHAYVYGIMYPSGSEQNHGSLTRWGEGTFSDLSNYNAGVPPAYEVGRLGSDTISDTEATTEGEGTNNDISAPPLTDPKKQGAAGVNNPKGKSQVNTLLQRFSVQRYLNSSEMKSLVELTCLTYKQVKTWFQKRRMKLRRHQDTTWVSERFSVNKESMYSNIPSHMPLYQGEARPPLSTTSPSAQQAPGGWSMPPGVSHYDYNPCTFNLAVVNVGRHICFLITLPSNAHFQKKAKT